MSPVDPSRCRIWAGNTRDFDPARSARLVELEALIETQGQLVPAVGRLAEDGTIEIVDGARRLKAVNNLLARDVVVDFYVELRDLDDEQAFLLSTGANEGREGFTAAERARSYRYMLDSGAFASEVELAAALGIDKSNVNRTLDVLELPEGLTSRITDPFKRRPRDNDPSLWKVSAMPEARIVSDELWQRVKARQAFARAQRDAKFKINGNPLAGAKRPTCLLSDLVRCGECGDNYVASGGGRWRCRVNFRKGPCSNRRSVKTTELEERVLAGVRERLLTPELIDRYAGLLQKEIEQANRERDSGREQAAQDLGDVRAKIAKLVQQIEEDDDAPKALVRRLKELETEEGRLTYMVAAAPASNVVRLPSNYAAIYRQSVTELEQHLAGAEAAQRAIRSGR